MVRLWTLLEREWYRHWHARAVHHGRDHVQRHACLQLDSWWQHRHDNCPPLRALMWAAPSRWSSRHLLAGWESRSQLPAEARRLLQPRLQVLVVVSSQLMLAGVISTPQAWQVMTPLAAPRQWLRQLERPMRIAAARVYQHRCQLEWLLPLGQQRQRAPLPVLQ